MTTEATHAPTDTNWGVLEHFGSIFVINLEHAVERRERITKSLSRIGIGESDFEYFVAIDGRKDLDASVWKKMHMNWAKHDTSTPEGQAKLDRQFQGEAGCYISHLRLIQKVNAAYEDALSAQAFAESTQDQAKIAEAQARVRKYSSVLILEDDCGFGIVQSDGTSVTLEKTKEIFKNAMKELPEEWKMLYFNALVRRPSQEYSQHLVRLTAGDYLNAYAVHHSMYKHFIAALSPIDDPKVEKVDPVDTSLHRKLHPMHPCYCIIPSIAYQEKGTSYITSKEKPLHQKQADAKGLLPKD